MWELYFTYFIPWWGISGRLERESGLHDTGWEEEPFILIFLARASASDGCFVERLRKGSSQGEEGCLQYSYSLDSSISLEQ